MVDRLILAMERVEKLDDDGLHRFNGYLDVVGGGPAVDGRYNFREQTYREALKHLINWARDNPEADLFLLRLDQKPPIAAQLEPKLAMLLREDPVAFMRMMDPTMGRPQKLGISMGIKKEHSVAIKPNPLPAGHDTLADAFGDDVYIRRRHRADDECALYESPITGRWVPAGELDVWTVGVNDKWAVVTVKNLLGSVDPPAPRFFLPRRWNKDGPWISREDLQKKYDEFCKERSDAELRGA